MLLIDSDSQALRQFEFTRENQSDSEESVAPPATYRVTTSRATLLSVAVIPARRAFVWLGAC